MRSCSDLHCFSTRGFRGRPSRKRTYEARTIQGRTDIGTPNMALLARSHELASERRRFDYRRLFMLVRREVKSSGINSIHRPHREEGLSVHRRRARRKAIGT